MPGMHLALTPRSTMASFASFARYQPCRPPLWMNFNAPMAGLAMAGRAMPAKGAKEEKAKLRRAWDLRRGMPSDLRRI